MMVMITPSCVQIVYTVSAVMASFAVSGFSRPVGVAAPARRPLRLTARPSQMRVKASPTTEVLRACSGCSRPSRQQPPSLSWIVAATAAAVKSAQSLQ